MRAEMNSFWAWFASKWFVSCLASR